MGIRDDGIEFELDLRRMAQWIVPALGGLLILLAVYVAYQGFYTVEPNEQAVVLRFGRYHTTALPGLHFCVPLVDRVHVVGMEEHTVRLPFGEGADRPTRVSEEDTLMLTGDLNAVSVEWTVQWKVVDPKNYLFSFYERNDPRYLERVVHTAARTIMNQLIGDYSIDEVLTEKRTEIERKALEETQRILDQYQCGILIRGVQMQRVTPPARVKPAWDAIEAANQRREQFQREAEKERFTILQEARAEKITKIEQAKGYAQRRRAEVAGEIAALRAKYAEYQLAPDITRRRLYLEAMQDVLGGIRNKIVIDSELPQLLPLLNVQDEEGRR